MERANCRSIRDALAGFFSNQVEVSAFNDQCVITLPIKTLDDRYIDVYVEYRLQNLALVHDGGKAMAELFAQGIHLTDTQQAHMKQVARRHDATFQHGTFQIVAELGDSLHAAVLSIAQCAAIAMMPVVLHQPTIEDEPLTARVARSLKEWKPDYVDIERRKTIKGRRADHVFDFVSFPRLRDAQTVAIKMLPPSFGPRVQADRYGFLAYDIQDRKVDDWKRLAVISKVEEWPTEAIDIVRSLSADVITLETDQEHRIEVELPPMMTALTDAA